MHRRRFALRDIQSACREGNFCLYKIEVFFQWYSLNFSFIGNGWSKWIVKNNCYYVFQISMFFYSVKRATNVDDPGCQKQLICLRMLKDHNTRNDNACWWCFIASHSFNIGKITKIVTFVLKSTQIESCLVEWWWNCGWK